MLNAEYKYGKINKLNEGGLILRGVLTFEGFFGGFYVLMAGLLFCFSYSNS